MVSCVCFQIMPKANWRLCVPAKIVPWTVVERRPAATQSCYETVGCTWQKGPGTETAWVMEEDAIYDILNLNGVVHI